MSDKDITLDDARDFFEERGVKIYCRRCGNKGMKLHETDPGNDIAITEMARSADYLPIKIIAAIGVFCENCGYIDLYSRKVINEWREGKSDDS